MDVHCAISRHCVNVTNVTVNASDYYDDDYDDATQSDVMKTMLTSFYVLVCVVGLCGNTLVIYVVLRFAKMKTVTNAYIMNLAIADEMFLLGIPFLVATMWIGHWPFGAVMCKIYMTAASLSQFTSSLFLAIMSFDRYFVLCHPLRSMKYRTMRYAKIVCVCLWSVSVVANMPVIIFAGTAQNRTTCTIMWPGQWLRWKPNEAFIWYSFLLGFAIPVFLTSVFYATIIRLLRWGRELRMSLERERSEKKVTKMVLTVVTCYVICWLPYWILQVSISADCVRPEGKVVYVVAMFYSLAYGNSLVNPLLYAYQSNSFRSSFIRACVCVNGGGGKDRHTMSLSKGNSAAAVRVWNFNAATPTTTPSTVVSPNRSQVAMSHWRSHASPPLCRSVVTTLDNEALQPLRGVAVDVDDGNGSRLRQHPGEQSDAMLAPRPGGAPVNQI